MAIQANSLSSLISLADDPPVQRGNSPDTATELQEPLVLYIARVPGSQDVFLTTMKPRQKVVTAQDVESSLYYCHLNSTQDEDLWTSIHEELAEIPPLPDRKPPLQTASIADGSAIHRKPVPPARNSRGPTAVGPGMEASKLTSHIDRKPVRSNNSQWSDPFATRSSPLRKLVGPRPLNGPEEAEDAPVLRIPPGKENLRPSFQPGNPPQLPPRQRVGQNGHGNMMHSMMPPTLPPRRSSGLEERSDATDADIPPQLPARRHTGFDDAQNESLSHSSIEKNMASHISQLSPATLERGFSVTLIRRDPGSGTQWNVGKITKGEPSPEAPPSSLTDSAEMNEESLLLEINTPGYDKFMTSSTTSNSEHEPSPEISPFVRRLDLQRQKRDSSANNRRGSTFQPANSLTDASDSKPLSFTSPWSGTCKFETGLAGRSLKCRHFPSASASHVRKTSLDARMQSINSNPVSELRFNFPGVSGGDKSSRRRLPLSAGHSRSSFFSSSSSSLAPSSRWSRHGASKSFDSGYSRANGNIVGRYGNNSHSNNNNNNIDPHFLHSELPDEWDEAEEQQDEYAGAEGEDYEEAEGDRAEEERMDLSLGQERAGGGFGGKKAKLGKLIVEREGLLMLDLVVAANMGVWWTSREKRNRKRR